MWSGGYIPAGLRPIVHTNQKLVKLKIFFIDKSKQYDHNIGVGSFHTLAHLPTFTVFSQKERGYSGTSAYTLTDLA